MSASCREPAELSVVSSGWTCGVWWVRVDVYCGRDRTGCTSEPPGESADSRPGVVVTLGDIAADRVAL